MVTPAEQTAATAEGRMRSGLFLPLFDELADPALVARLSAAAEEAGWDAVFVWDHLRWREPVVDVADPWITLTAIATATERIRIGPMVTPLARHRPVKVARESATLDWLSGGRLTLGVGLGNDQAGRELSITGEETDNRRRARMLDESLQILTAAWSGEPVHHRGEHYTIDGMRFLPRPVQRPGIPVWVGGFYGRPVRMGRLRVLPQSFPLVLGKQAAAGRHLRGDRDRVRPGQPETGRRTRAGPDDAGAPAG